MKALLDQIADLDYVAIVASSKASDIRGHSVSAVGSEHSSAFVELQLGAASSDELRSQGVQMMSGAILFGLIYAFLLIAIVYCVVSIMGSVQTPLRFPGRKMPVNKEF